MTFGDFWKRPAVRQTFVASGLMSVMFSSGLGMGTATVMLPQLKKSTDDILVDDTMASWLYSVHGFGSVPAVLTVPYLCQKKGYKLVFIITCLPLVAAFILQYFATTSVHLLIAAIFQGLTMGSNVSLGIIAITEYADPRLRSMFLVIKSASYFWGIWVANILGTFTSWRYIPLFGIWPSLYSILSCFAWPEGPYWLASVGRIDESKKSYSWLFGPENVDEEISSFVQNCKLNSSYNRQSSISIYSRTRKTIVLRQFYMPLVINCVSFCLYFFTAKTVVTIYALDIIKEITKDESTAYLGMLIIDGITVFGMYIGSYVAMRVRRRAMFFITSATTIFFLYLISLYLTLVENEIITQKAVVSLSLLVIYSFCVSWGPMILSTSFTSEITPMRFKAFIISVGSAVFWLLHSVIMKLAPLLFKSIGMHGGFSVFATLTLICWLFLYKYLPDTFNKTLAELEHCFLDDKDKHTCKRDIENNCENGLMLQDLSRKD